MTTPLILSLQQIEEITSSSTFDALLIDAIEKGFASFSSGKFNVCPIQTMGAPPMAPMKCSSTANISNIDEHDTYAAQVCVKSGYMTGESYFVIKVASGGAPWIHSGSMQVYSQATGQLQALLMDQGLLTELRTAAAGAVATKCLGPKQITHIGLLGTGVQARYQLQYHKHITDCRHVMIYGRTPAKVELLQRDLQQQGWHVTIATTPNDLMMTCNLIITTTCARTGLLTAAIPPKQTQTLLVCIGADAPGKQELNTALVASADCLVCDCQWQTQERGEFQHALHDGIIHLKSILELGTIIANSSSIPTQRILTIFDSSGVAFQDCIVAKLIYESFVDQSSKYRNNSVQES